MLVGIVGDVHLNNTFRCRKDDYLQSALDKLAYVASKVDKVIILGDLFHKFANDTLFFNTVYKFFSRPEYEGVFCSILGNHDTAYRQETALNKTTIGSLELTGVLTILRKSFTIDNVTFDISSCKKDISKLGDEDNCKILLGHNYFEMNEAPDESFTRDEIRKLNYNMVMLGHDHKPYEEERIGNTTLVRMGSLTRIDSQTYNEDREICYYEVDTKTFSYVKREVPSKPVSECYIDNVFTCKGKKEKSSYAGLSALLSKFDRQDRSNMSIAKVLREMKATDRHITYLREIHRDCNLRFD